MQRRTLCFTATLFYFVLSNVIKRGCNMLPSNFHPEVLGIERVGHVIDALIHTMA